MGQYYRLCGIGFVALLLAGCSATTGGHMDRPLPDKPTVLIIGDSISMQGGYFPGVVERLGDGFTVVHNPGNGSDSANVLAHLEEWISATSPDIIHFNCGLHDIKFDRKTKTHQQPQDAYERHLRQIVACLLRTDARLIFALTTPVNDEWHANKPFDRHNVDVEHYNAIARKIVKENGIPIDDLHAVIARADPDSCLVKDGVHMNAKGNALLADAVADAIRKLAGR